MSTLAVSTVITVDVLLRGRWALFLGQQVGLGTDVAAATPCLRELSAPLDTILVWVQTCRTVPRRTPREARRSVRDPALLAAAQGGNPHTSSAAARSSPSRSDSARPGLMIASP